MPGWSDITTLVTPGGTITHGNGGFLVDPDRCSGLGMGEVRGVVDNKGKTSGYILHDRFEGGTHFVIGGMIDTDVVATRNALQANLKAALRSILLVAAFGTQLRDWRDGDRAVRHGGRLPALAGDPQGLHLRPGNRDRILRWRTSRPSSTASTSPRSCRRARSRTRSTSPPTARSWSTPTS